MIAKQGVPDMDWAGTTTLAEFLSGGATWTSLSTAAATGALAQGAWYFGKAAVLQGYHSAKSTFHTMIWTVEGCPGSLLDLGGN